jgi:hypothetical protein
MKVFYVALSLFLFFAGFAHAQKIGEPWTDRTGLYVHYSENANLLLRMEDHHFMMLFLDDAGKVTACPFKRAIVYVDKNGSKKNDMNLVLRPEPGAAFLSNPRFVKPPLSFRVRIILCPNEDGDEGNITIPMLQFNW